MTPRQRNRWRRRIDRANRILARGLEKAMRAEFRRVGRELRGQGFDVEAHRIRTISILRRWYLAAAKAFRGFGEDMLEQQRAIETREDPPESGGGDDPPFFLPALPDPAGEPNWDDLIEKFIRENAEARARKIAARTQQAVTDALVEAGRDGMGEAEAYKKVAEAVEGEMSRARARAIARTEIGAAQNKALIASAEARGQQVRRQWLAIHDHRTRPTHAAADGQTIEPGEKFRVGLAMLDHPGDPTGPPGEIINCRCSMLLIPIRQP